MLRLCTCTNKKKLTTVLDVAIITHSCLQQCLGLLTYQTLTLYGFKLFEKLIN